jgi:hypothetical protein
VFKIHLPVSLYGRFEIDAIYRIRGVLIVKSADGLVGEAEHDVVIVKPHLVETDRVSVDPHVQELRT